MVAHLSFRGVRKIFANGVVALDEVSFDVPRGQFCVVLGPSGSGKSTLLRLVNGLIAATSGTIRLGSLEISPRTLGRIRGRVAMIHQQFNLVERACVADNVLAGAIAVTPAWRVMLGWYPSAVRNRASDVVRRVGLSPIHLRQRVAQLSGGQAQRVGIARALLLAPELILADEPVASLDPALRRDIMALIAHSAREQRATVLCTLHQTDLAREFADRIICLHGGRLVFDGPPHRFDERVETQLYSGVDGADEPRRLVA